VLVIEVEVIDAQPRQRAVARAADVLGSRVQSEYSV